MAATTSIKSFASHVILDLDGTLLNTGGCTILSFCWSLLSIFFHTWHDIIYVYAIISILWLLLYYYLFHVPFCGRWHCCRSHEKVFGQVWKEMGWQSSSKNSREDTFGGCNRYCGGLWAPLHNRRIYFWNYPIVLWSVNSLHFLFALSCSTYIWIFMDGPIKNLDPILEMLLI